MDFPKIPCASLGLKDADSLESSLQQGKPVTAYLRTMAQFLPDTTGHNVIGKLTGSALSEECIMVGGHLDSWNVAEGAQDDGAGCVESIEVLRALKAIGYKPKHTARLVLFTMKRMVYAVLQNMQKLQKRIVKKHIFGLESDNDGSHRVVLTLSFHQIP